MLLVAVTGPVGVGKSSTLLEVAARLAEQGREVDGFVSIAGPRAEQNSGARAYQLRWLGTGSVQPWAVRGGEQFRLDPGTLEQATEWAKNLPPGSGAIVFLDEFGKWEANGAGLRQAMDAVFRAKPFAVVVAVREGVQLPIPPTLTVLASDPRAAITVLDAITALPDWIRVGRMGAASGALEFSVGSVLHTIRFPLVGMAMSAAQTSVMTWAGNGLAAKERVSWVAFISAGLKALSPAGSKLGPMLAITVQGLLYAISTRIFGWNIVGVALGSGLAGAWAGSQAILMQWLLYGGALLKGYDSLVKWMRDALGWSPPAIGTAIGILVALHAVVGVIAGIWVWRRRASTPTWLKLTQPVKLATDARETWLQSFKFGAMSLVRPAFLVPTVIVVTLVALDRAPAREWIWIVVRAIALGWVLFALARRLDFAKMVARLRMRGQWGPAMALEHAASSGSETYDRSPLDRE